MSEQKPPRSCGGCAACCEIVPVKEISLRAYTRCPHARDVLSAHGPGCGIYAARPYSCRSWSCGWLKSPNLPDALRPDRSGIVIDELFDICRIDGKEVACAQIWAAPGHEEDFQRPEIQRIVEALFVQNVPVVLWRTRTATPGGPQMARALVKKGDRIMVGPIAECTSDLGDDGARLARAWLLREKKQCLSFGQ